MKKVISILFFMILVLISRIPGYAESEDSTYILPADLVTIEEEAFANTPVETVILPEGFQSLEDSAFEDASQLTDIYIPPTTNYIADTAFPKNTEMTIHGVEGSYAEDWAEEHHIPFVNENIWRLILNNGRSVTTPDVLIDFLYQTVNPQKTIKPVPRAEDEDESKRPQDRPELNPIDYRFP